MFEFLGQFFDRKSLKTGGKRDPKRYEQEKAIARGDDVKKRLSLAKSSKTHQEILYYLAEKDPDDNVRRAVARNRSTPVQASELLATDTNVDVRMALAGRLVDLLPELTHDKHAQLYAFAVQSLGTLALDEVLKIRKALSSALKDHAHTPPKVAAALARDIEREVAEPILRFCTALEDGDLLEILQEHPAAWAMEAAASRPKLSEKISKAIIESGNEKAGAILLKNDGAMITQVLLEYIVDRARDFPEWHEPIAKRNTLSPKMAKTLASFVDKRVRRFLLNRSDFDKKTIDEISEVMQRRMAFEDEVESEETPAQRVTRLFKEGRLDEEVIHDALGMRDRDFVVASLAALAKLKIADVNKVIDMQAPKPICALTWKAGLSMRLAFKLQQDLGQVAGKELLYPKDGTDYPLTEEEMRFQLDFLGLEAA